ncbi:MAG TPA: Gfo/Idh/MocA family oxidoreductase [Candidatus Limnocylindrales bacterium]|nr:Gfo/Idh/MocA family oxidoreductase [Candidatus Limnocylindrales bacterium]
MLRWGVLGTGRITPRVVVPMAGSPRNTIAAVASREADRSAAYAATHGIPRSFGSYDALIDDPDIDVIYVALPNHLHAEWTIRALEAGKHVLCEKPLALTVDDVEAVAATAARTNRVAMEAFMYLHHPQTRRVLELIRDGELGSIQGAQATFTFQIERDDDPRLVAGMGGGTIWDLAGYPVSLFRRIAGAAPASIAASGHIGPSGVDLSCGAQLRYESGFVGQLFTSFEVPFDERVEIFGSDASLVVRPAFVPYLTGRPTQISVRRGEGSEEIEIPLADPYLAEVENLADAVLDGATPEVSLIETRTNVATLVAIQDLVAGRTEIALAD